MFLLYVLYVLYVLYILFVLYALYALYVLYVYLWKITFNILFFVKDGVEDLLWFFFR